MHCDATFATARCYCWALDGKEAAEIVLARRSVIKAYSYRDGGIDAISTQAAFALLPR